MSAAVSSRLPEIISILKILKNVVALAPLGDYVGAGIELAISICEMAQVRATVQLPHRVYLSHSFRPRKRIEKRTGSWDFESLLSLRAYRTLSRRHLQIVCPRFRETLRMSFGELDTCSSCHEADDDRPFYQGVD
jgi:hypothetical protein